MVELEEDIFMRLAILEHEDSVCKLPAGRPKGSKDSKDRLTIRDKARIKILYIRGERMADILRKFNLSSSNGIYRWIKEENWDDERANFLEAVKNKELEAMMAQSVTDARETLADLGTIRLKAMRAIENGSVTPARFGEASKSFTESVDLERKIRIEGLELSFVTEIAKVLKQEIQDTALLSRIGIRLRELFQDFQKASVQQLPVGKADDGTETEQ